MLKPYLLLLLLAFLPAAAAVAAPSPVTVTQTTWHGWTQAVKLSNGIVEAVIVPQIGRVMAFEFAGQPNTNPLYENPDWTVAKNRVAKPGEWANYGGDKVWPAPQSDWPRLIGHDFPPDPAFDGLPEAVTLLPSGLRLSSPASAAFGLRIERTFTLRPGLPRLYLSQTLVRTRPSAAPDRPLAVWAITQVGGDGLFVLPLPALSAARTSPFPLGYQSLSSPPVTPPFWRVTVVRGRRVLLGQRDPDTSHKVATKARAGWLARVSDTGIVFAERTAIQQNGLYPDSDSPSEIYSNAGNSNYLELEMLGPLRPVRPGHPLTTQITWQLTRLPSVPSDLIEAANQAVRAAASL